MKKKQAPVSNATENSLEDLAQSEFHSGHYKEAIRLYKKLLQTSDNDFWIQQLSHCYLQRALSFAARGMVKEALVLWDNYTQHAQLPYEAYDHYISWLIETKNQDKIQTGLGQLSAQQLDKQYPGLAALLGLLMLTEHPEFQPYLPQDSAFIAHFKIAQTALQAYQDDNQDKLNEVLKQIPYRSAFRDFRTLLNAVVAIPAAIEHAQSLLAKIPPSSPYAQTTQLLLACTREGSELAQDLIPFNHKQRKIIAGIKGLNKKQLEFIERLTRKNDRLSDKIKFNLVIQYQSMFGSELAKHFCQTLLATYPAGRRDFNKHFTTLNAFEENRLKALTCERDDNIYDAEYYWRLCVKALSDEESDNGLKIALILRHIAVQQGDAEEQIQLLIESLEYDPEDLPCYLQIMRYFGQQQGTIKDYKEWLSKTIEKFPQDITVLTLAIQTATRNKAYKKASLYAKKILKIDPLNTFAKQVLFSSHLAHTRWLIQGKKYHLVENEIQQAEDLNMGKRYTIQTQLMRGLFYFSGQDKKQGLQLLTESLNKLHSDPVNAFFQAAMEALLTGLPVATVLRKLPAAKDHLLSEQELNQVIQQLKQYAEENENHALIHKALEKIKPVLKKSLLTQEYDENQMLTLCQTLDSIHHFELLRHCVKSAVAKWKKPIWEYYHIYSETNGSPERCPHMKIIRLESMREQTMQDKDHRAMVLIDSFLNRYYQAHPERNMGFLENLFGIEEEYDDDEEEYFDDPLEQLFNHIPESVFLKLNKKIEALAKKTSPERLIQSLTKDFSNNNIVFQAMMQDPDLFMALMVIKAADSLNIDIYVSVDEVLECFGLTQNTGPIPF